MKENGVLEVVSPPLVVRIHHTFQTLSLLHFGLEFYSGEELFFHFSSAIHFFFESRCRSYALEILLTFECLRCLNISNCDLKL